MLSDITHKAHGTRSEVTLEDQRLQLVPGQRGKLLLLIEGYTLPRNNVVGATTYWCCRWRHKGSRPCNARATTTRQPNGLHRVVITRREHNHPSTLRPVMLSKVVAPKRTIRAPQSDFGGVLR